MCSLVFVGERSVGGRVRCDGQCPYTCNASTWTVEAGGRGRLHPHSKFEVLLGHIRPRLKGSGCEKVKKISWDRLTLPSHPRFREGPDFFPSFLLKTQAFKSLPDVSLLLNFPTLPFPFQLLPREYPPG